MDELTNDWGDFERLLRKRIERWLGEGHDFRVAGLGILHAFACVHHLRFTDEEVDAAEGCDCLGDLQLVLKRVYGARENERAARRHTNPGGI